MTKYKYTLSFIYNMNTKILGDNTCQKESNQYVYTTTTQKKISDILNASTKQQSS